MSTQRQRDAETDRLLRATLQPGVDAEACPDADMLAAFVEETLSPAERDRLDVHFAECHRCQEALAMMVRTATATEQAQAPAPDRWWSIPLRWLVPLATAALVVLYLAVRPVIAPYFPTGEEAIQSGRLATPKETMADARTEQAPRATIADRRPADEPTRSQAAAKAPPASLKNEALGGAVAPPAAAQDLVAPPVVAPAFAPAAAPAAVSRAATRAIAADSSLQQLALMVAATARREIKSPDGRTLWRFGDQGRVLASADNGATWRSQSTGVSVELLAGSAPSATVCWIVGRDATILVTTDGAKWTPRPFPEPVDLVAVEAADATSAIVTTRDGRRFATNDGGITWSAK